MKDFGGAAPSAYGPKGSELDQYFKISAQLSAKVDLTEAALADSLDKPMPKEAHCFWSSDTQVLNGGSTATLPSYCQIGLYSALQRGGFEKIFLWTYGPISGLPNDPRPVVVDANGLVPRETAAHLLSLKQPRWRLAHIADWVRIEAPAKPCESRSKPTNLHPGRTGHCGAFAGPVGAVVGPLRPLWSPLEFQWGPLGSCCGAVVGPAGPAARPFWGSLGPLWGPPGGLLWNPMGPLRYYGAARGSTGAAVGLWLGPLGLLFGFGFVRLGSRFL